MKILIVEDNPLIASAVEQAGEALQLGADRVSDGWEAIEKLETEDYAAIVIDTDLPRQSGFGVLTYLREEVGDDLDHVIVVTSSNCDDVRRRIVGDRVRVIPKNDAMTGLADAVRFASEPARRA
jgi:DNA-binding response OmpR family regulator